MNDEAFYSSDEVSVTVHKKYLVGKILANHGGKSYWRGKI